MRSIFKFGTESGLIEKPVLFGPGFKKPSKAVMRRHRARGDKKMFTAAELRRILAALNGESVTVTTKTGEQKQVTLQRNLPLRAAVLMGINAACGNTDVSALNLSHLDLNCGWLDFPRVKTGLERRVPLWTETTEALMAAIIVRPQANCSEDEQAVFLNRNGRRLVQITDKSHHDGVSIQFSRVLKRIGLNGRHNTGFYSLRHTAATIGLQTGDRSAVRAILGHAENDVLDLYNELGVGNERLLRVVQHVRDWLFESAK